MRVGLVGLGRMGGAIAQRLRGQGCEIVAWDHDARRCQAAATCGATVAANAHRVAGETDIVISIITEDHGVRRVFTGPEGFLSADVRDKLFIEMSTLQPMTGRELGALVEAKGARLVESPVLGTIPQVREGKLLSLAGGRAEDVDRARTVLDKLARRVVHMGPHGAGYAMKLAVNLGLGAYIQALSESLALGTKQGLSLEQMLDVLEGGADRDRMAPRQDPGAARRQGRRHARPAHDAQGHHVGGRDRRAFRRADAAYAPARSLRSRPRSRAERATAISPSSRNSCARRWCRISELICHALCGWLDRHVEW